MSRLLHWLAARLCRERLIPDRKDPATMYLTRNYLFGNASSPWFLALHQIHKSDADHALHTHPFSYLALQLSGVMYEHQPGGVFKRRAGYFRLRSRESEHRLELPAGPVWSLFFGFGRKGSWGFRQGARIVDHKDYLT